MGYTTQIPLDEETSHVLGIRQMVSKSTSDTLETLKVVLGDMDYICKNCKNMQLITRMKQV